MIQSTKYVIAVPNLEKSAAFYRDVLGFEIKELGGPGWRFFIKDNCCIMAGECPDATPAEKLGDHSYFAYMVVSDIDEYFKQVSSRGVKLIKTLKDESWAMREFGVRTIDGHRIMFGCPIAEASKK